MRAYEDLKGAEGRRLYYRAERFGTRDLFQRVPPGLRVGEQFYTLHDISMNGLAAFAPRDLDGPDVGERLPIRLDACGTVLHEGMGEVCRVEATPFGNKLGIRLTDRCVDLRELVSKYHSAVIRADLDLGSSEETSVMPDYRQLCADVLYLLRSYRTALDRFAATGVTEAAQREMLEVCEDRIWPQWCALWHRGNEIMRPLTKDSAAIAAAKRFTEVLVTPELVAGPFWQRSYEKPLGYPGDFEVMNYVYDWRHEGNSLFGRLVHRLGVRTAECVAVRMRLMRDAIAEAVNGGSAGATTILSLGCGSAREVSDYLRLHRPTNKVSFTLIDQDHAALGCAYERTYPEVLRLAGDATVTCLQASFIQLMRTGELFRQVAPQDLIYSVGLLDYLAPKRAKALVTSMFDQLVAGGTLIVGNMLDAEHGTYWPTEFLCDWSLIYRTEQEMRDLAADVPAAEMTTAVDPTGCVVLLRLRKL